MENMADYVTKHHPIWNQRTMQPRYLKPTKKYIENSKYWITGNGRGCAGTINPRVIRKSDNTLKIIRNSAPQKPDNPLKGIWNLVPNRNRNQWTRGLTVKK